ncbi:hypothetical protein ACN47E_004381 [Coniothyrium glycines]
MRLIDTSTIELRWFNDNEIPIYAIMSHTWGPDEITFQDLVWINRAKALTLRSDQSFSSVSFNSENEQSALMLAAFETMIRGNMQSPVGSVAEEDLMQRSGYSKIIHAAEQARNQGYKYIWIDTCCIDKSSSAELQEAINSMYRWYRDSGVCIVYLEDVLKPRLDSHLTASEIAKSAFEHCRWVQRGWTLQEAVAPTVCRFYFHDWTLMGEKAEFLEELSEATGIPVYVLEDEELVSEVSVAERMSWAADRKSTRLEDVAYSLLGIFDIHMPLLYGEGTKAFTRLQEEILRSTDDYSLFAWTADNNASSAGTYRGLLARSPSEFRDCRHIERERVNSAFPIGFTPIGLRVQLEFLPVLDDNNRVLALLRSSNALNQRLAIHLKCLDGSLQYARVNAGALEAINDWPTGQMKTVYVRQKLFIPPSFRTSTFTSFHIRRRLTNQRLPPVRIVGIHPRQRWDETSHQFPILEQDTESWAAILLRVQSTRYAHSMAFPVAFGFNKMTRHYWCKAVVDYASFVGTNTDLSDWSRGLFPLLKREHSEIFDPLQGTEVRHDMIIIDHDSIVINVSIEAGLCGDSIALQVNVDGLMKWQ